MYWLTRTRNESVQPPSGGDIGALIHADIGMMNYLLSNYNRATRFRNCDIDVRELRFAWRSKVRVFTRQHPITTKLFENLIIPVEVPPPLPPGPAIPIVSKTELIIDFTKADLSKIISIQFQVTWENNRKLLYQTTGLPLPLIKDAARGIIKHESYIRYS